MRHLLRIGKAEFYGASRAAGGNFARGNALRKHREKKAPANRGFLIPWQEP
jgi:hypothetical protein